MEKQIQVPGNGQKPINDVDNFSSRDSQISSKKKSKTPKAPNIQFALGQLSLTDNSSNLTETRNQSMLRRSSRVAIRKGSKSFALAGLLLSKEKQNDVFMLYNWCRFCDDIVDKHGQFAGKVHIDYIRQNTCLAMANCPELVNEPAFRALGSLFTKYEIPFEYPMELIAGLEMDSNDQRYNSIYELDLYCYRVAGVVGLMMAHILGVSEEKALEHACDMGMAMQLTNIARDIKTDWEMGRSYLPYSWLIESGVDVDDVMSPFHRQKLVNVVGNLLKVADRYYKSGEKGLKYLDWRTAWAIQSAANIYRDIGRLIRKKDYRAWDNRVYTSKTRKVWLIAKALVKVCGIKLLARMKNPIRPWRPVTIKKVLKFA